VEVFIVQFTLGVGLFFIINWIGKHSFSIGYVEIALFVNNEEAPALNFLIRVLTPIIYLLISSTLLYALKLDRFVNDYYLVSVYYVVFRLLFNIATQRRLLLNWVKQIIYWVSIVTLSFLVYDKIIRYKKNLLPDFASMANELWIIIIVFIFQLLNSIELPTEGTEKRTNAYLNEKFNLFKKKYHPIIKHNTKNEALEIIAYAILIYEDFNRPKIARWVEYISFYFTKKLHSLGVMQFPTEKYINDVESVDLGTRKLRASYEGSHKKLLISNETSES
jgi:hypothetical protein